MRVILYSSVYHLAKLSSAFQIYFDGVEKSVTVAYFLRNICYI